MKIVDKIMKQVRTEVLFLVETTRLCPGTFVPRHICAMTCYNIYIYIYIIVWSQFCLGTNIRVRLCPHKRVRAQTCVGTIMYGHKGVGTVLGYGTEKGIFRPNSLLKRKQRLFFLAIMGGV